MALLMLSLVVFASEAALVGPERPGMVVAVGASNRTHSADRRESEERSAEGQRAKSGPSQGQVSQRPWDVASAGYIP